MQLIHIWKTINQSGFTNLWIHKLHYVVIWLKMKNNYSFLKEWSTCDISCSTNRSCYAKCTTRIKYDKPRWFVAFHSSLERINFTFGRQSVLQSEIITHIKELFNSISVYISGLIHQNFRKTLLVKDLHEAVTEQDKEVRSVILRR